MTSTRDRYVERVGIADIVSPMLAVNDIASANTANSAGFLGTARTSQIVDMENINKAIFVIRAGSAASATANLKVEASTSTASGDFTQLVGLIGTNTAASATCDVTGNQVHEIEVAASVLQESNYRYLRAIATVDLAADDDAYMIADLSIYVDEANYNPVRSSDMLSYKSTNASDVQTPMYVR